MTSENRDETVPPGRFKPGVSGNPGGRPRRTPDEINLAESARAKSKDALDIVLDLMVNGSSERIRLAAALAVIERGCGKPGDVLAAPLSQSQGSDVAEQARTVLAATMRGELSMPQASALLSAFSSLAKIVEAQELAARVAALEKTHANKP